MFQEAHSCGNNDGHDTQVRELCVLTSEVTALTCLVTAPTWWL